MSAIRTGSVLVLWGEMEKTLSAACRQLTPRSLAHTGSLLVRIISETKRGKVAGYYRIAEVPDGIQVRPCAIGRYGWEADTGTGYTIRTDFDPESARCNCPDATKRTRFCKHVLATEKLAVIPPQRRD